MHTRIRHWLSASGIAILLPVAACSSSDSQNLDGGAPVASGTSLKSGDSTPVLGMRNVSVGQVVVSFVGALTNTDSCVVHVLSVVPDNTDDGLRFDKVIRAPSGVAEDYFGWRGSASEAKTLGFTTENAVKGFDIDPGAIRTDLRFIFSVTKDKNTFTSRNVRVAYECDDVKYSQVLNQKLVLIKGSAPTPSPT